MAWPKVTLVPCPRGDHDMVAEDGFCEHCAESDMESGADRERSPLAPCGWCRRCAIHDDPGGCLTVEAYARERGL